MPDLKGTIVKLYDLIDQRKYSDAYQLFSDSFKHKHPFLSWSKGYADTLSQSVASADCGEHSCSVEVVAREVTDQGNIREEKYNFEYDFAIDVDGHVLVDDGSLLSSTFIKDVTDEMSTKSVSVVNSNGILRAYVDDGTVQTVCHWNYTGGNHAVPYEESTRAIGSHSIVVFLDGLSSDVIVRCHDDQGNLFQGAYTLDQIAHDTNPKPQQPTQLLVESNAPNGTYTNVHGNEVPRPFTAPSAPVGASAQCYDGTYSFSQSRRGTCSHHGGVMNWY